MKTLKDYLMSDYEIIDEDEFFRDIYPTPVDGKTPTEEELLALIKPLIPDPLKGNDGHTPTKQELTALIKPLIPPPIQPGKPKDGHTPTKEELTSLIRPLIPPAPKVDLFPIQSEVVSLHEMIDKLSEEIKKLRKSTMYLGGGSLPTTIVTESFTYTSGDITLSQTPKLNTEKVFVGGQRFIRDEDYTITGRVITPTVDWGNGTKVVVDHEI